jgi:dihydroxy-acid dehydratase
MAIGGSTNAVVHLMAIAGRAGVDLSLSDFDRLSRQTPFLANVKPSGEYVMEDFFYAGGLPAVMRELLPLLDGTAVTVTGRTVAENLQNVEAGDRKVVRALDQPIHPEGGTAILYGSLAPDGAVIKQTAASARLLQHRGRALVFSNFDQLKARIDDPALDVDENTVLVLQNAGPRGGPGMPEWGHLPIPAKLLKKGIDDMVRISDARMSGTSFGTDVLHVAPEAAVGGPLALVQTGDEISLDVDGRRLDLCVPEDELNRRRAAWRPAPPHYSRGYGKLFLEHVTQANLGCDFDFLIGRTK